MNKINDTKTITQAAKEILDLLYKEYSKKISYYGLMDINIKERHIFCSIPEDPLQDKKLFNDIVKTCNTSSVLLYNALKFLIEENFIEGGINPTLDGTYHITINSLTSNGISLIEGYNLGIKQKQAKFMLTFNIKEANLIKDFSIIKAPFALLGKLFNQNKLEKDK